MDIDLLSKMVKELILDSDRVVLPGLGAFMAEIVPSSFSDKGYTINPPYRKLYFRSRPDEGDELVEFYARTNNLSKEVADKIIRDFVSDLGAVLRVKKTVVFPGLGRLRATKENNIFFVANEDVDIYPAGFGLEPISLKTHQESREEVVSAVSELKSILQESESEQPQMVPQETPAEKQPEATPEVEVEFVEPQMTPEPESEEEVTPEEVVEDAEEVCEQDEIQEEDECKCVEPCKERRGWVRKLLVVLAVIVSVILLLAVIYMAVSRMCPDWIDQFLYTQEELDILNYRYE